MRKQNRINEEENMNESNRQLLTVAVFLVAIAVGVLLYAAALISWVLILPVVLLVFGCWMLALAYMQSTSPVKYARGAFGTMALGLTMIAVGGAWFLFDITGNALYALALVLLVLAGLGIAAALRHK
jgi:1,4-dihydroxy-2-naphthoate octaprenyltransferase